MTTAVQRPPEFRRRTQGADRALLFHREVAIRSRVREFVWPDYTLRYLQLKGRRAQGRQSRPVTTAGPYSTTERSRKTSSPSVLRLLVRDLLLTRMF